MRTRVLTWAMAVAVCMCGSSAHAEDVDRDGIDDALEQAILDRFAPIWRPDCPDGDCGISSPNVTKPPLPVRWYVERCQLVTVHQDLNSECTDYAPNLGIDIEFLGPLSLEDALVWAQTPLSVPIPDTMYFRRLHFENGDHRNGNDPTDLRTWEIAEALDDCVYGRVCRPRDLDPDDEWEVGPHDFVVQYYLFFGFNEVNGDQAPFDCPLGNHEGDVICVDFDVTYVDDDDSTIRRGIFHNHGRQIFVSVDDDPEYSGLELDGGHPVVYLEQGVQEPWPYAYCCGFGVDFVNGNQVTDPCGGFPDGEIGPLGVTTNKMFEVECGGFFPVKICVAGECEFGSVMGSRRSEKPVVRPHQGRRGSFLIESPINLGEWNAPMNDIEATFVQSFNGKWGHISTDCCVVDVPPFGEITRCSRLDCPEGPSFNSKGKMWDRKFTDGWCLARIGMSGDSCNATNMTLPSYFPNDDDQARVGTQGGVWYVGGSPYAQCEDVPEGQKTTQPVDFVGSGLSWLPLQNWSRAFSRIASRNSPPHFLVVPSGTQFSSPGTIDSALTIGTVEDVE